VIGAIEAIDDAVEAIPVHLAGGSLIGCSRLAYLLNRTCLLRRTVPLKDTSVSFFDLSDGKLLGCQFLGVIIIAGWISIVTFPLFGLQRYNGWFRVN
jgi:ammonia channel protein AmtB